MSRRCLLRMAVFAAIVGCCPSGFAAQGPAADAPQPGTRIIRGPQYRLKITALYVSGQGMRVVTVEANGPGTQLVKQDEPDVRGALDPGDIITHVDGTRIQSLQHYYDLMKASGGNGGKVVLRVRDVAGGQMIDWEAAAVKEQGGGGEPPPAPPVNPLPPGPARVHVLLIGLTDDEKIGRAQETNLAGLEGLLRDQIAPDKLGSLRVVKGRDCNSRAILAAVDALRAAPTDSVFCYYGGHGAYDPSRAGGDPSGGHHFQIPSGDLMRKTLLTHLRAKGTRLTVLITDTCNVKSAANVHVEEAPTAPAVEHPTALEILLLEYKGVVDISASSRGQFSWNNAAFGGWFTYVACKVLQNRECSTWKAALDRLSTESNDFYQMCRKEILAHPGATGQDVLAALRGQTEMVPQAFQLQVERLGTATERP